MVVPIAGWNERLGRRKEVTGLFTVGEQAGGSGIEVLPRQIDVRFVAQITEDGGKLDGVKGQIKQGDLHLQLSKQIVPGVTQGLDCSFQQDHDTSYRSRAVCTPLRHPSVTRASGCLPLEHATINTGCSARDCGGGIMAQFYTGSSIKTHGHADSGAHPHTRPNDSHYSWASFQ